MTLIRTPEHIQTTEWTGAAGAVTIRWPAPDTPPAGYLVCIIGRAIADQEARPLFAGSFDLMLERFHLGSRMLGAVDDTKSSFRHYLVLAKDEQGNLSQVQGVVVQAGAVDEVHLARLSELHYRMDSWVGPMRFQPQPTRPLVPPAAPKFRSIDEAARALETKGKGELRPIPEQYGPTTARSKEGPGTPEDAMDQLYSPQKPADET